MSTLKSMSRRGLAWVLTVVMCLGMVNLSAFAMDEELGVDIPVLPLLAPLSQEEIEAMSEGLDPNNPNDAETLQQLAMMQYPLKDTDFLANMDGSASLGEFLFKNYPKNGLTELPENGVWSAEGKWEEDDSDVLVMDENGHATINEPKGPAAQVTVKYTYTHEVEATPPADDQAPKAETTPAPEITAPVEGEGDKADTTVEGEKKDESTETPEPSETPDEEENQDDGTAAVNPDADPDEENTDEENNGEPQSPVTDPEEEPGAQDATEDNGEADSDEGEAEPAQPEAQDAEPESEEGKNGEEGEEGDSGLQPEQPETTEPTEPPQEEEPTPSEEPPATTTKEVQEVLTWKVMFTSEVEPLAEVDINSWSTLQSKLQTAGNYRLTADIKVEGTVTVNKNVTLNLNGKTLSYAENFKGNMFEITGNTFTITGSGKLQGIDKNTGSLVLVNGGTFKLEGGTLTGNKKGTAPKDAIVWANVGNTSSPEAASPIYFAGAGVYVKAGKFEMSGGSISGNSTIGTDGYKDVNYLMYKELRTGYLGKDKTRYEHPLGQGGGVYVAKEGAFKFTGGNISSNQAGEGGGIFVKDGVLTMSGSAVVGGQNAGNIAHLGEGGGIYIQSSSSDNKISGGQITYNETHTTEDLGGGGIYVENSANLKLINARITANDAYGLGGGIAACVHGKIALVTLDGAAVYSNTAQGAGFVKSSSMNAQNKGDTVTVGEKNWRDFIDSAAQWVDSTTTNPTEKTNRQNFRTSATDIFSAGDATQTTDNKPAGALIGNVMIGGGLANWKGWKNNSKNATFSEVKTTNNAAVSSKNLLALNANPTADDISKAEGATGVLISNNKSTKTHGGGVATNGMLALGETSATEINNTHLTLTVKKNLTGRPIAKGEFTFELLDKNQKFIGNGVTSTNGAPGSDGSATAKLRFPNGIFDSAKKATKPGADNKVSTDFTFYVKEKNTGAAGVEYDMTLYKVVVTVTATKTQQKLGNNTYTVDTLTVGKPTVTKVSGPSQPEDTTLVFNNTMHYGSLKLVKAFAEGSVEPDETKEFNFKVTISGLNGAYGDVVFVNGEANVKVSANEPVTITGIPSGLTYQVEETDVANSGYTNVTTGGIVEGKILQENVATAKITNKRDLADLTVKKTVPPVSSTSEPAPDSNFTITVKLGDGSGEKVSVDATTEDKEIAYQKNGEYTLTVKKDRQVTIKGIPTDTAYTVDEAKIADYNRTDVNKSGTLKKDTTVEVVNHYFKMQTVDQKVTKVWSAPDTVIPGEAIIVQLQQDGKPFKDPVLLSQKWHLTGNFEDLKAIKELDESNAEANESDWTYIWSDLEKYVSESDATPHSYSVKELYVSYGNLDKYEARQDDKEETIFRVYHKVDDQYIDNNAESPVTEEILGGWIANPNGEILENKWIPADELGNTSLAVKKIDFDNGNPIKEVTFTLTKTKEGNVKDETTTPREQTTNDNGVIKFEGLTDGEYILKEQAVKEGYRDDEDAINASREWTVTVVKDKLTKVEPTDKATGFLGKNEWSWKPQTLVEVEKGKHELFDGEITIKNQIIKGNISIKKSLVLDGVIDDIPEDFQKDIKNIFKFSIYPENEQGQYAPDAEGKLPAIPENVKPIDTLEVQGDGKSTDTSIDLRYGWYILRETVTAELPDYIHVGTEFNIYDEDGYPNSDINQIEIFIDENGKTHEIYAANHYTHDTGSLSIGKTVVGVPTEQKFAFTIELKSLEDYIAKAYETAEGKITLEAQIAGIKTPVVFEKANNVYTGEIELAANQTATFTLPTNTEYTVTEKGGDNLKNADKGDSYASEDGKSGKITEQDEEKVNELNFTNTLWRGDSVNLTVRKVLSYQGVDMSMLNREFKFNLFQVITNEETQSVDYKKVNKDPLILGGNEFNVTPRGTFKLEYNHDLNPDMNNESPNNEKTFHYVIREEQPENQHYGWAREVNVAVTVAVEKGEYKVTKVVYTDLDGNELTEAEFNNKVDFSEEEPGKFQFSGMKNLNGTPSDRAFQFTLTDVTDPENRIDVEIVSNTTSADGRGVIRFKEFNLTDPDMLTERYQISDGLETDGGVKAYRYVYEIREISEGAGNLFIDKTVYTVTVDVKDEDGQMKVQSIKYTVPVVAEDGSVTEEVRNAIVFNNILTPPPPVTPPPTPGTPPPTPDEPVPDPDVPLVPGPGPDPEPTPEEEFPGDDVPQAPAPELPEEEVFDGDVPLATMPPEEEEVFDEDVPLATVPKTGDTTGLWAGLTALSGLSLAALGFTGKRKDDDEQA